MSEEMSIKQQKKKNWIPLAGCDWAQLLHSSLRLRIVS